jgi:hypothetical protein
MSFGVSVQGGVSGQCCKILSFGIRTKPFPGCVFKVTKSLSRIQNYVYAGAEVHINVFRGREGPVDTHGSNPIFLILIELQAHQVPSGLARIMH